jgi:PII-like signaling protein
LNGCQLTFYTGQNRKHGHQTVCEWLLHEVRRLGIHGATVINAAEGVGHEGARHAAHALRLADQPLQIILAVTDDEAEQILALVMAENVHVFYTRFPIEFGVIGDDPAKPAHKRFSLTGRSPK